MWGGRGWGGGGDGIGALTDAQYLSYIVFKILG